MLNNKDGDDLLDINKLYPQIESLSLYQRRRSVDIKAATKTAIRQMQIAADDIDNLRNKIKNINEPALIAIPTDENPAATHSAPPCPESYTVLSTDGSQIEPSRHNSHPAFLINIGEVSIGYEDHHGYSFTSKPSLFFESKDTLQIFGGEERPAAGTVLAALRQKMEAETLSRMIAGCSDKPAVALIDGTLILWTLEQRIERLSVLSADDLKQRSFHSFMNLINTGKNNNTPVAGYISSPAGSDVVNMLKINLCPLSPVNCGKCPYKQPDPNDELPCATINGITDSSLFGSLLGHGQRSSLFESRSEILNAYKRLNPYGNESVFFFYLNTGKETARVEIPRWVKENMLDLTHAVCLNQADKGIGYPVAIAEAHEQAVVKGPDRNLFHQLIERALIQNGTPVKESGKALRKRGGLL